MEIMEKARKDGRKQLAENEVKELLKRAAIPTTDFQFFHELSEVDNSILKFPVVLKVCSPEILHKTDVGGVVLDIESMDQLTEEFSSFKERFPGEGFLVEPMYTGRVEIIIGVINDATFGPTIMFGLGGVFTEVYKDVTFRVIPLVRNDAEEMISEIRAAPVLEGFRRIKVYREGIIELLLKVSELGDSLSEYLDQMDLNPVMVSSTDIRVVDANMILK